MSRTFLAVAVFSMLVAFPFSWSVVNAQENGVAPTAPVPSLILIGKNAFISNGGVDGSGSSLLRMMGDVNQPYESDIRQKRESGTGESTRWYLPRAKRTSFLRFDSLGALIADLKGLRGEAANSSVAPSPWKRKLITLTHN